VRTIIEGCPSKKFQECITSTGFEETDLSNGFDVQSHELLFAQYHSDSKDLAEALKIQMLRKYILTKKMKRIIT